MRPDLTKAQHRRIRELAGMAYERELSRELRALESDFVRWRGGEIDAFALSDRVHRFHQGPSQRLFLRYTTGMLEVAVANAIASGTLTEEEATAEIVEALKGSIEAARAYPESDERESASATDSKTACAIE
jgi:hypothetical protein